MNHIRRAAYFNSSGATYLGAGENGKAFKSFKISLQCLAQAIIVTNEPSQAEKEVNSDDMISRAIPRSPLGPRTQENGELDGQPYIYGKGLVFYPNSTLTLADLTFYCSVVVFNLVLTYHRKSKNLQERDLNKLLQLYELCLQLIREGCRSNQYDCGNLLVATLNNKSVVHSALGQHTKARRLLYPVWDVMKNPQRRPGMLESWEIEGIFLNIFLILINAPQVAEAA
jgi:hypothetical protein